MPILLVFAYVFAEAAAFWAVSTWLGFWGAFFAMFAVMFLGSIAAGMQLRRRQRMGDMGLLMIGAILSSVPGYATSALGLVLLFPPTRALVRNAAARRLTQKMEDFGVRMYSRSPMASQHTSYGFFDDAGSREVIDEDEIRDWTNNVSPEDFKRDQP